MWIIRICNNQLSADGCRDNAMCCIFLNIKNKRSCLESLVCSGLSYEQPVSSIASIEDILA